MEALASTEKMLQDKVNKTSKVVINSRNTVHRESAACQIRLKHFLSLQFKYSVSLSPPFIFSIISASSSVCSWRLLGTLICWDDLIGGVLVSTAVGGRGSDLTLCVQVSPCQMVWANGIVKRTSMESLNQRNQCELMEQV